MKLAHTMSGDGNYALILKFSQDSQYLVSAGMNSHLHLWSTQDWSHDKQITGHDKSVNALAFNIAGTRIASGSSDCMVRIWSFPEFELLHELQDRKRVVSGMTASSRQEVFAICSYGGRIAVWDFQGRSQAGFRASSKNLSAVDLSPDDDVMIAGGLGGQLIVRSWPEGQQLGEIQAHAIAISYCGYFPDRGRAMTLGYDGFIKIWDSTNWSLISSGLMHEERITGFFFDLTRERALILSRGLVRLIELSTLTCIDELAVDPYILPSGAISPDGKVAVIGSADARFFIVEIE